MPDLDKEALDNHITGNYGEDQITCPYGDDECFEDDPTTLCDGCREDKAWDHAQGFMDTFD